MVQISDTLTKPLILLNLLSQEDIASQCIIFTRSNETAARLARLLSILDQRIRMRTGKALEPFSIGLVTGEIDTSRRKKTLRAFASNEIGLYVMNLCTCKEYC